MTKSELRQRLIEIRDRATDPEIIRHIEELIKMITRQLENSRYE